jgi:hypothetical protein
MIDTLKVINRFIEPILNDALAEKARRSAGDYKLDADADTLLTHLVQGTDGSSSHANNCHSSTL